MMSAAIRLRNISPWTLIQIASEKRSIRTPPFRVFEDNSAGSPACQGAEGIKKEKSRLGLLLSNAEEIDRTIGAGEGC